MGKKFPDVEQNNRQAEPKDTARTGWPEEQTPSEKPVERADSLEEELYTITSKKPTKMATKTQKTKSTKATKTNAVTEKVASLKQIREAANLAFDQHFTRQRNKSWMLSQIAENNPGLVYYWNPTNIGIKLKKAAVDVNKILENMGFQERKNKTELKRLYAYCIGSDKEQETPKRANKEGRKLKINLKDPNA